MLAYRTRLIGLLVFCEIDARIYLSFCSTAPMIKSIIVAKAENNVIGKGNQLPWHMPADLRHFKRITMGHHVIMGRKTFASIGRPLPGRKLITVTRNLHYRAPGCAVTHDIASAMAMAERAGEKEVFIAGGEEIYRATLAMVDKIYLTVIKVHVEGDACFPTLEQDKWLEVSRVHHAPDSHHPYAYDFVELTRATPLS